MAAAKPCRYHTIGVNELPVDQGEWLLAVKAVGQSPDRWISEVAVEGDQENAGASGPAGVTNSMPSSSRQRRMRR